MLKMEDIFFLIEDIISLVLPATCGSVHSPDSITMASGAIGGQGVIPAPHINTSAIGIAQGDNPRSDRAQGSGSNLDIIA